MTKKDIHVKVSQKRHTKLKAYAETKEKTITQLIEDWIDRLPATSTDWLRTYVSPDSHPHLRRKAVFGYASMYPPRH